MIPILCTGRLASPRQIMRAISHPNIIKLRYYYYETPKPGSDEVFLNLVLEWIPETIYTAYR